MIKCCNIEDTKNMFSWYLENHEKILVLKFLKIYSHEISKNKKVKSIFLNNLKVLMKNYENKSEE